MHNLQIAYNGLKWIMAGLIVFSAMQIAILAGVFEPKPYWGVTPRLIERTEDGLNVIADFTKGECSLVRFSVAGIGFDGVKILDYTDLDNRQTADGQQEDRIAGDTTLRVSIPFNGVRYDVIELRTRHNCVSADKVKKVDKIFLRVPV